MATAAPTPTVPPLAAAQALAPSRLVLVAAISTLPAWSMRAPVPMVASVCAFDAATASAPATPTLLPPAPATPSAASLRAKSGEVFCNDVAVTARSPACVTCVSVASEASVRLSARLMPTPTATPTCMRGSTASPAPRALKLLSLRAATVVAPPDDSSRPPVTVACTSSLSTFTPTAAAIATLPPPCAPWLVCAVWLVVSVLLLVALSDWVLLSS